MKLQFKHQKFQADAAKAVVDVFAGQPYLTPTYMMDKGDTVKKGELEYEGKLTDTEESFTGWANQKLIPALTDDMILDRIRKIQRTNQIKPSDKLEGRYNLTIEMETGVGKTYTYIKTMYELNKAYGWSKFIVVVPSIAIREGVYKSFQITQDHFAEEYGKKIRFFIYNSARLTEIDRFASDSNINVMIINSQAFNAKGKDARRIYMKLDEFRSRRPIDIIAKTNPVLIIDEPQSVEGKQTKERLKEFNPLLTLRYSATHKTDSIYNMIYRLDAIEAYNKKLVKKIAVKGISTSGTTGTEGFVFLESINVSGANPTATIRFDVKGKTGVRQVSRTVNEGFNLYDQSGQLEEYKNGYTVSRIDARDDHIEFISGKKLFLGDIMGSIDEEQIRRIQIYETIVAHIEREKQLFYKGIKVLSLFFIDEVAKYKQYDEAGQPVNGVYADMFEEEYRAVIDNYQLTLGENDDYLRYLDSISAENTHSGYFSIDNKGKLTDGKIDKKEKTSDDVSAYDLIMKNKELLLDRDPKRSPVRFIFSHSALREGWDNPNVFQICTLKQSTSEVRKRQEVGRGMRLCVNEDGDRMDMGILGNEVHNINVLTVIASESYESFAKGLQSEIAEDVAYRPKEVTVDLFVGRTITDNSGNEQVIDQEIAQAIHYDMIVNGYIDKKGSLTDKYYEDKANGSIKVAEEVADSADAIVEIIDSIYDEKAIIPEDARRNNIELKVDDNKLAMPEFKALWERINSKSAYVVNFETEELIKNAVTALNSKLRVHKIFYKIETGSMDSIASKEQLEKGEAMKKNDSDTETRTITANRSVKYDLVGKLVTETGLTRKDIVRIMTSIEPVVFDQYKYNPEEFILKSAQIINDQKATAIIEHITYHVLDDRYGTEIFTEPTIKGKLNVNAMKATKHLYDHIIYDSDNEHKFATELDTNKDVAVYVKLPNGFYISTPVGKYNPDWAIAFYEGTVKHIYFIAETKGTLDTLTFGHISPLERAKIDCAREHFKAISSDDIVYDVVDDYSTLLAMVTK
ncbi:DEAD/DEAH box helicase family protein [Ruminococcus sp.]|uniref:type III restriction-modification system endonuclease n=1 Tax=Ruminococcus sp. TaxID=41978 RepID=UPI0025CEBB55|nr:DEAD/DEAH box helicase family protein [Ruminococcus sp.]MBR1431826.1 DEAD/DEAH box helicase family protein [Ruminococcus sp.]